MYFYFSCSPLKNQNIFRGRVGGGFHDFPSQYKDPYPDEIPSIKHTCRIAADFLRVSYSEIHFIIPHSEKQFPDSW